MLEDITEMRGVVTKMMQFGRVWDGLRGLCVFVCFIRGWRGKIKDKNVF